MIKNRTLSFRCLGLLGAVALLGSALVQTAIAQTPSNMLAPPEADSYIVTFAPNSTGAARAKAALQAGAMRLVDLRLINSLAVRIPDPNILAALRRIQPLPGSCKIAAFSCSRAALKGMLPPQPGATEVTYVRRMRQRSCQLVSSESANRPRAAKDRVWAS